MARLKITLTRSPIGAKPAHRKTVRALGLRKMHQSVVKNDDPAIRGMIRSITHMVEYEEMK
ncbi:MAG: 50S ribosomal protein L30 [Spirochaetales bacterium]|nr:50S ribosomal protein L30 [Spirochaetales bacterium]